MFPDEEEELDDRLDLTDGVEDELLRLRLIVERLELFEDRFWTFPELLCRLLLDLRVDELPDEDWLLLRDLNVDELPDEDRLLRDRIVDPSDDSPLLRMDRFGVDRLGAERWRTLSDEYPVLCSTRFRTASPALLPEFRSLRLRSTDPSLRVRGEVPELIRVVPLLPVTPEEDGLRTRCPRSVRGEESAEPRTV